MKNTSSNTKDTHCTVLEQKYLVSEMTRCDHEYAGTKGTYDCYLQATQKSRESNNCMYS